MWVMYAALSIEWKTEIVGAGDPLEILLPASPLSSRDFKSAVWFLKRALNPKWSCIACGQRMGEGRLLPPALTPGARAWNSKTPLKARTYVNKSFLAEQRFIWESGCQHSFPDLPAPSNNIDLTFLPAASRAGQPRLTSVGTVQGTGHMNSAILCWPTLAPLFQAMNRAVWKKKSHTK